MWAVPQLSGEYLIVEQDLPDSKGRGNNVYLFKVTSGQRITLTEDGHSSMPGIAYPWVIWKDGPRYTSGRATVIYDLRSHERRVVPVPGVGYGDPQIAGHWLYWNPGELVNEDKAGPLYIYDLETDRMFSVAVPEANERITSPLIHDDIIGWVRNLDAEHAAPTDTLLEWRAIP